MSKTCKNCGNVFDDSTAICPRCGTQYVEEPQNYQQPQYQQSYTQPYPQNYQQPYQPPVQSAENPMTLGSWLGTIILTSCFGPISIILLFVWGFGSNTPESKKNYCRAMLIIDAIILVLSIIFIFVFMGLYWDVVEEGINDFLNEIRYY